MSIIPLQATGACIRTLTGHKYGVGSIAFSPDGINIVSGSDDKVRFSAGRLPLAEPTQTRYCRGMHRSSHHAAISGVSSSGFAASGSAFIPTYRFPAL